MASSLEIRCIEELSKDPLVMEANINQCAYGLMSKDKEGEALAHKPAKLLTNIVALQRDLSKKCQ